MSFRYTCGLKQLTFIEAFLKNYKIWILNLILPLPYGRLLTGLLIFSICYPFFSLGINENPVRTPALFFSLILAYIIPLFSFITEKNEQALAQLKPSLDLSESEYAERLAKINSTSLVRMFIYLLVGAACAMAHLAFIRGSLSLAVNDIFISWTGLTSFVGGQLVWIIMTMVIYTLVQQSIMFSQLGAKHTHISLLTTRKLIPFARVSISSSLLIVGALVMFPLMGIGDTLHFEESGPGIIATLGPLIVIFIMPVWPLHKKLSALKETELERLDLEIEERFPNTGEINANTQGLAELTSLLDYRREIKSVSTWPFDGGAMARLALYMIIPPLTWVGAAFVENFIDSFL